jgi:hypothetical protein
MSELDDDLAALVGLGGNHASTIPGTMRPTSPAGPGEPRSVKGWEPGYKVDPATGGLLVTTVATTANVQRDEGAWHGLVEELGLSIPEGWLVRLVEAKYDSAAWVRDKQFTEWPDADAREARGESRYTKTPATREGVWRYRFAVEPSAYAVHNDDVNSIIRDAMRVKRKRKAPLAAPAVRSLNVVYADPQAGKVALLGGTRELVGRFRDCIDMLDDHVRDLKGAGRAPDVAAWLDAGDSCEGFQNVTAQKYTNDLSMTQQIRVHRRLTFSGLDYLAGKFPEVKAASCGSNHARVRDGKDPVGPPDDDWGLEVLSQVQDAYSRNEDAYGHVKFAYPPGWRDTLCLDLGGMPVGLAHGHQFNRPEQADAWWKGQTFGNQPVTDARILVTGHFHHFAAKEIGNGRLWVQAPTLDNGSDWYTQRSGEVSQPGLLVFSTTEDGWDDLRILRPDPIPVKDILARSEGASWSSR